MRPLHAPLRNPASLSRPPESLMRSPRLLHSLRQSDNSVLSVVADENHIFSGSQAHDISVWCRKVFSLKTTLKGHTGSILALEYASDKRWLISSSGDSTVRIWSTVAFTPLYVLHPSNEADAGDIFSLAWCPGLQTIIFGCQNTSIQWFDCSALEPAGSASSSQTPVIPDSASVASSLESDRVVGGVHSSLRRGKGKVHKFFDSYPQYERRPADEYATNGVQAVLSNDQDGCVDALATTPLPLAALDIPPENVVDSAHFGYVYAMALLPSTREGSDVHPLDGTFGWHLVTGSGDETIKVWKLERDMIMPVHTFECGRGAVLSLVTRGDAIYAGCQDGYVTVWDLETETLVRNIIVHENCAVLSLSMLYSDLYTCCEDGRVQRWSAAFDCTASWTAHEDIVLSSIVTRTDESGNFELVTGGNDDHIKIWKVDAPSPAHDASGSISNGSLADIPKSDSINDTMLFALSKFISIPSVSKSSVNREDCRQAAIWLRKCLTQLGADSTLLSTGEKTNPLVLATFTGSQKDKPKPRVLFYGHYDVIAAPSNGWASDPFTLDGRNGYLYGRGVTDNKGPILAVACAAAELLHRRALAIDLVFLIEGEEEAGSGGFEAAVKRHKGLIGHIDAILVSNSTWITEDPPCITYGLRGVVHCGLEIKGKMPDLHSGVEGGAVVEPMLDMVKLLATLVDDKRRVLVPGFYDRVRPLTEEERQNYQLLSGITQRPASLLSSRWREPSLTIHNVEVSGPNNSTVIPGKVKARISVRIVPDQGLDAIAASLCEHLKSSFRDLQSPNALTVSVDHTADWWLGDLDDPWFKALENAVYNEWGIEPLRIREGGSIPSVPFLEKELKCHALHLPMGQSSDQAHLPNERISLANLRRGKSVVEKFLVAISGMAGA